VGTRFGLSGLIRLAFLAALGIIVLTGCATMAKYQEQAKPYQGLADQATGRFGVGTVTVTVSQMAGFGGRYDRLARTITLVPNSDPAMRLVLAHELGHHILGHTDMLLAQEMAANAMAVKVLQVWGMTEEQAYRGWANRLLWSKQQGYTPNKGHDFCAEFADLRDHYPNYLARDPAKVTATCPGAGS